MYNIKDMPPEERPYEKCRKYGAAHMTDTELLAVILRTGVKGIPVMELAAAILSAGALGGLASIMYYNYEEFIKIRGIGSVKAIQLLCLAELVRRIWKKDIVESQSVFSSPKNCAAYYMQDMRYLKQEELRLAFLDTRQRLIADKVLSIGTINSSLISVREVLIEALRHQAVNIIMLHNHPSGNPSASEDDRKVTLAVKKGCEAVGLVLNDHIIIGDNSYYSFKEQGVL